ncbi:MAG: hypothetical protein ACREIF_18290 [Chthoniobacterales bacterium]
MVRTAQKQQKKPFKQIVNDALRAGLVAARRSKRRSAPFRTGSAKLGRCLVGDLDDVAEVLAVAEGESFS